MNSIRNSLFRNLLYKRNFDKKILAVVVVIAGILAVASPALAAGGGSGPSASELIWQAVNLVLLLGVLFAVARKPITAYFAERREQIQNDIKSADKLLAESKKQFSEWQGKLVELEAEVQTIRDETRQRALDERDQIVAAAHDSAERIRADAVAAVDQELRRAQVQLREEAANLAIDLAASMITEQVDDRDRDRLLDEFITRVEPATIQDSGTGN
ncbi:MAG: F0F1 ATP synthase subunit B [Proteobacteria bacterium]|nr:F0F1 ATP synthase subunit B [Pseudomonadota bacterium]